MFFPGINFFPSTPALCTFNSRNVIPIQVDVDVGMWTFGPFSGQPRIRRLLFSTCSSNPPYSQANCIKIACLCNVYIIGKLFNNLLSQFFFTIYRSNYREQLNHRSGNKHRAAAIVKSWSIIRPCKPWNFKAQWMKSQILASALQFTEIILPELPS